MTLAQWGFAVSVIAVTASIAAVVVSIVVAHSQRRVSGQMAAIEEARRAEEIAASKRARVVPRIEHVTTSRGHEKTQLVLLNDGLAEARNVTLHDQSVRALELGLPSSKEPIPVLGAGQEFPIMLMTGYGMDPQLPLSVSWEDDLGSVNARFTLNWA